MQIIFCLKKIVLWEVPDLGVIQYKHISTDHWYEEVCAEQSSLGNLSPPGQNGRYFADDIFKWTFLNGNV